MKSHHLAELAGQLPGAWSSRVLAQFGDARLKVLRMDDAAYPEESHDHAEGLLVIEGELRLRLDGQMLHIGTGELCIVPPGMPHSVEQGSRGTLLILDT